MAGIKGNRPRKQAEKLHRERLERQHETLKPRYNAIGEAEVVPGYQLSSVLKKWIVEWLVDHPLPQHDPQFRNGDGVAHIGPVQYLAEKTGINLRRVSGICNGEFLHVPLSQADLLLSAAERWERLGDEIQVVQNPNWSFETWIAYMESRGCI